MTILDEQATAAAAEREKLLTGWERWLRSSRWGSFATGTWGKPVTGHMALGTVKRWLARYPTAYAVVGIQRGPLSLTHHVHVLIGGVERTEDVESDLRGSWVKGGHVKVEGYQSHRGGVSYVVRQAAEIELLGTPTLFIPKRKRRKKHRRATT